MIGCRIFNQYHRAVTTKGIFVNRMLIPYSNPKLKDGMNRTLPQWQPLDYQLEEDEVLTMTSQSEWSFDVRYYGPVHIGQIMGAIIPIRVKNNSGQIMTVRNHYFFSIGKG